ncbi:iron-containing alcohol dehydrogenase [Treponema sp. J25]|jgi:alcohol dehydrogenase|uniref:iron-containing alcohol dehydrogenase n=1 Tax=Treponema sp. J25 TaxID=2094121 RepID=UPI00104B820B|nr:iron-containing alcohol dehydrogenase [Treponema sp. J25]TCW61743.1 iron-containing alcohol dehydrogenase [Treponema sp. J25]
MVDFVFKLDPKVIIGTDTINWISKVIEPYGNRVMVVTEPVLYENNVIDRVSQVLSEANIEFIVFDNVPPQATAQVAEEVAELARAARCSVIIGLGGIKTQAIAKIASLVFPAGTYLFDILDNEIRPSSFLPYVAVPTSGRDPFLFANSCVAVDPRDRSVKLVETPESLCVATILDENVSESLSEKFAATTAFDGFLIAFEAYLSTKISFIGEALLERAFVLYRQLFDSFSTNKMGDLGKISSQAGFLTSLGASVSSPGIGTALAYALNARFPVAKSWCSTILLPHIMEFLLSARPERLARIAELIGEPTEGVSKSEAAHMAIEAIRRWMGILQVPARLKDLDLVLERLVPVAETARALPFVAYSPRPITVEETYELLKEAY